MHAGAVERRLVLASALILFLELAAIRWLSAHVLYMTFFTNVVLLASFLGMSLGCLAASSSRRLLASTPPLLLATLALGLASERSRSLLRHRVDVGQQASPEWVFFGTEGGTRDVAATTIPMELIAGAYFLLVAATFIGPGQALGRALAAHGSRVRAYGANLAGSCMGIVAFTLASWLSLPPPVWFGAVAGLLAWLLRAEGFRVGAVRGACLLLAVVVSGASTIGGDRFSPYYRVALDPVDRTITVNLIGHQTMVPTSHPASAYALPHLLMRDAGLPAPRDVLIVGAGSGNDVSRALQWGASRVDAVEIDPVIQELGRRHHPDAPYADPRVHAIVDDGRNALRASGRTYDLIVYALVDSLVLHSSVSSLRLESYLFTREAFLDVREHLAPGGTFAVYNFFRQGWIVGRLHALMRDTFGADPVVVALPSRPTLGPEDSGGFTLLLAGNVGPVADAFARHGTYRIDARTPPAPGSPDGFRLPPAPGQTVLSASRVVPDPSLPAPTDDWPHLYLRKPSIPGLTLRGLAVMGVIAVLLVAIFMPRGGSSALSLPMFLLGAGFMLVETGAVVQVSLLAGSTWIVNALAFLGILVMSLCAALLVGWRRPASLRPWIAALLGSLVLRIAVPLPTFLGLPPVPRVALASVEAFLPILFAGVIFTVAFARSRAPDRDFGWNVAGAMAGGFLENVSLWVGFRGVAWVALLLYAAAGLATVRALRTEGHGRTPGGQAALPDGP